MYLHIGGRTGKGGGGGGGRGGGGQLPQQNIRPPQSPIQRHGKPPLLDTVYSQIDTTAARC